ncbi:hypothetical protein, partial [Mesorhizobium sp. M0676]|uniref:hypothetical protein n=1 Tax=Mesorhizobium sp. M0676 TaxID=2956984 RepID=UPI0033395B2C
EGVDAWRRLNVRFSHSKPPSRKSASGPKRRHQNICSTITLLRDAVMKKNLVDRASPLPTPTCHTQILILISL